MGRNHPGGWTGVCSKRAKEDMTRERKERTVPDEGEYSGEREGEKEEPEPPSGEMRLWTRRDKREDSLQGVAAAATSRTNTPKYQARDSQRRQRVACRDAVTTHPFEPRGL